MWRGGAHGDGMFTMMSVLGKTASKIHMQNDVTNGSLCYLLIYFLILLFSKWILLLLFKLWYYVPNIRFIIYVNIYYTYETVQSFISYVIIFLEDSKLKSCLIVHH